MWATTLRLTIVLAAAAAVLTTTIINPSILAAGQSANYSWCSTEECFIQVVANATLDLRIIGKNSTHIIPAIVRYKSNVRSNNDSRVWISNPLNTTLAYLFHISTGIGATASVHTRDIELWEILLITFVAAILMLICGAIHRVPPPPASAVRPARPRPHPRARARARTHAHAHAHTHTHPHRPSSPKILAISPRPATMPLPRDGVSESTRVQDEAIALSAVSVTVAPAARPQCAVCMADEATMLFRPCMHLCCCKVCAERVEACPLCRTLISGKEKVFIV
jgi:hypothetical protein